MEGSRQQQSLLILEGRAVEQVQHYKCLDVIIDEKNRHKQETTSRTELEERCSLE